MKHHTSFLITVSFPSLDFTYINTNTNYLGYYIITSRLILNTAVSTKWCQGSHVLFKDTISVSLENSKTKTLNTAGSGLNL